MNQPPTLPGISTPCTGCGLCAAVCPRQCITMRESEEGFFVPVIDATACTQCGACNKICKRQEQLSACNQICSCYKYIINNKEDRVSASSGGFCTQLSRTIIQRGGVVYGVTLTPDFRAEYIEICTEDELPLIRGSKYLHADTTGCFQQIVKRIKEQKPVLFVGTSCQVRALRTLLRQDTDLLITVDIACYGVPSYHCLDAYLREINEGNDKLKHIQFKNKSRGWRNNSICLTYQSGREIISPAGSNPFMQAFDSQLCLNKACYSCHRNINERYSDITCADFWGHRDVDGDDSHLGISCIICHSRKGEKYIEELADSSTITPIDSNEAIRNNGGLVTDINCIPPARKHFLQLASNHPITPVVRRYMYSQGGRRLQFHILGFNIGLPETVYNILRSVVRKLRKR